MIIVCGCDGSGKSTLENKLQEKLHWDITKGSSFNLAKCSNKELFCHFINILKGEKNRIIDRFAHCNVVYASKFTDYAMLTNRQFKCIQSKIEENNNLLIYVHADEKVINERINKRGDDYIDINDIHDIIERYEMIFNKDSKFKYIDVDTTNGITNEMVDYIIKINK